MTDNKDIEIKSYFGKEIEPLIPELARLRITVFHDFPYLYQGDFEYEKNYLKVYTDSKESVLVAAICDGKIIGAATALPLKDETDYIQEPFLKANMNLSEIYYFGESVLLKEFRGYGIGHAFFDGREAAAKKFNYPITAFCGVKRPEEHPQKPKDYRPLDEFWKKRGYEKKPNLTSHFSWKDIGEKEESKKEMIYWMKK